MIYEVMRYIRNFFPVKDGFYDGYYEIKNHQLDLPFLLEGQYFVIQGSVFNDGVYVYPCTMARDEKGSFTVVASAPPADFLDTVKEIEEWKKEYGDVKKAGPYLSESFGGYSYQKYTNKNGNIVSWQDIFKERLNLWRKR